MGARSSDDNTWVVHGVDLTTLEGFLRRRLTSPLPGAAAQRRFAPLPSHAGWAPELLPSGARHAAALLLLYARHEVPVFALTRRHDGLAQHAGQVSLPGGAIDVGESIEAAALRETEEEIGVPTNRVRVIGSLSTLWMSVSNFVVHPVIGITDDVPEFRLHPDEVAELLEVPITHLDGDDRVRRERRQQAGREIEYSYFDLAGHVVWGATAMMLGEFAALCDEERQARA